MKGAVVELREREYSIDRLLGHVEEVSEIRGKVDVIVVLKSSMFIALYNNIEATAFAVVEKIHDAASKLTYDELTDPLKTKMLRYSFGKTAAAYMQDPAKVEEEIRKLRSENRSFPELSEYLRRQTLFAGNVDARKLNVLAVSYGIPRMNFSKSDAERMLWVKNKRNKIAHGEQSMSDGGKGVKNCDLKISSIAVSKILRQFINAADLYVTGSGFQHKPTGGTSQ